MSNRNRLYFENCDKSLSPRGTIILPCQDGNCFYIQLICATDDVRYKGKAYATKIMLQISKSIFYLTSLNQSQFILPCTKLTSMMITDTDNDQINLKIQWLRWDSNPRPSGS